jgi:DNA-3-methyladenine glycosylase
LSSERFLPRIIKPRFFAGSTLEVAPKLIGCILEVNGVSGRIVEVEAYTDDPASHGHRRTARSEIMHSTYGYVYVYKIYGQNICANITTDKNGVGAVLIRALEPLTKIEVMAKRRGTDELTNLCSGPGKLCQALGIDLSFNWTVVGVRVKVYAGKAGKVISTPRIGITRATDLHWRFVEADNPHVSRRV